MLAFHRPSDLALLDIALPDMDGLQVLAGLRADARTLSMPVMILSSWDDPDLIWRGFELGRDRVLGQYRSHGCAGVRLRRSLDHDAGTRLRCVRGCIPAERNAAQPWAKEMIQWKAPIPWGIKVIAVAVNDADLAPTIQISTGGGPGSTNPSW